jgi:hypothetical protein
MRLTRSSFLTLLASLPAAHAISLSDDDLFNPGHYRVDPYLRAAVELQALDRASAMDRLHDMAGDAHITPNVIILCRMLFTGRRGSADAFRPAGIGAPDFLTGTQSDWPLWPIEVVDGVPFMIVWFIEIDGFPQAPESHLHYCEENCDWTDFKYTLKTPQQKQDALAQLLSSEKWRKSRVTDPAWLENLTRIDEFFLRQIQ